jgi:hypothetical protein
VPDVKEDDLIFWAESELNVMFIGKHGVGKTAMVKEIFDKLFDHRWKYFSAATMDPWVDFIGVPKREEDEDGAFLDLILPRDFRDDKIEAIFLDEFNRAHKKVKNAVMELIQFKSINGRPFPNLKLVWAAINPDDDMLDDDDDPGSYQVEKMDKAQLDRFHVHVEVPYAVNRPWFVKEFGSQKGNAACDWWCDLSDDHKNKVSPRRLETAIRVLEKNGNVRGYVLPVETGVAKLSKSLEFGSPQTQMRKLIEDQNTEGLKTFLKDSGNWTSVKEDVLADKDYYDTVLPHLKGEFVAQVMVDDKTIEEYIMLNVPQFEEVIESMSKSSGNMNIKNKARKALVIHRRNMKNIPTDLTTVEIHRSFPASGNSDKKKAKAQLYVRPSGFEIIDNRTRPKAFRQQLHSVMVSAESSSSTYDREGFINKLISIVNTDINLEEATACLMVIDKFVSSSQAKKVDSIPSLHKCVNTVVQAYYADSGDRHDFVKTFPSLAVKYGLAKADTNESIFALEPDQAMY